MSSHPDASADSPSPTNDTAPTRARSEHPANPSTNPALSSRIAVVVNGNAKSVTAEVIETLDQILDNGDLFVSRRVEESEGIARTLVERGYGTILTGGGDGTFTVVVTAVVQEARRRGAVLPRFGLLRLGTGNSLAWVLGATASGPKRSRGLAVDLARMRADAGSRWMRFVEAEQTLSPFCGYGIDAVMLRDYNSVKNALAKGPFRRFAPGLASYAIAATLKTMPSYFVRPTPHCRVINEGSDAVRVGAKGSILGAPVRKGGVIYEGPAKLACVATIPYYGFGFRMFPYAEDRPDRMQLRITNITPTAFVRNFQSIWRGEYDNLEDTFDFFVDDVSIAMDPPTAFQIGGDVRGERSSVRVRLTEPISIVDFYAPPRG